MQSTFYADRFWECLIYGKQPLRLQLVKTAVLVGVFPHWHQKQTWTSHTKVRFIVSVFKQCFWFYKRLQGWGLICFFGNCTVGVFNFPTSDKVQHTAASLHFSTGSIRDAVHESDPNRARRRYTLYAHVV